MVEKPIMFLNFVRLPTRNQVYPGAFGIYNSGAMFMIPSSDVQEKSLGNTWEA